jgi:hypothetical protein
MLRAGVPCGRRSGHKGVHITPAAVERDRRGSVKWNRNHPDQKAENELKALRAGNQTASPHRLHSTMARLKAELGDPRPPGMTLSLINVDSPSAYWGYRWRDGERKPYRLSTNPDDYAWETMSVNHLRKKQQQLSLASPGRQRRERPQEIQGKVASG